MDDRLKLEWIETNGLGGWASSSILGANTRRYHGLLIAATKSPEERISLLSKLDETVVVNKIKYPLGVNQYKDGVIFPCGFFYLDRFKRDLFPVFHYEVGGLSIKKTITTVYGENTTLVIYEILEAPQNAFMEFQPFISGRDYHSLIHTNNNLDSRFRFENGILVMQPYSKQTLFHISIEDSEFKFSPDWYYNLEYEEEKKRGQDYLEDLYTPGVLKKEIKSGEVFGVIISTEDPAGRDALELFQNEKKRRGKLIANLPENDKIRRTLTLAADQFIVSRKGTFRTIIAGYHWFTDWGRDTMIALPGLTLATGRYGDAKMILAAFSEFVNDGLIPNRFPDKGDWPEYNSVDASLWFFIAVKKYFDYTNDLDFIKKIIMPAFKEIVDWHFKGTKYNIHVDTDGLLSAGEPGVQLTWMDAKVGNWVVTPRNGKAVEINSLWYNALMIYSEFLLLTKHVKEAEQYKLLAGKSKSSFNKTFWNNEGGFLADVIRQDETDQSIRPNQLFAISLPYILLSPAKAKKVLSIVKDQLFTPFGLRSLAQNEDDYKSYYNGNQFQRDSAYHQGTVWSWLLGLYIDALVKVYGAKGKEQARLIIKDFTIHFSDAGMGTISEIFDGDSPHTPKGCIAQAWSVGEILRVYTEYGLQE